MQTRLKRNFCEKVPKRRQIAKTPGFHGHPATSLWQFDGQRATLRDGFSFGFHAASSAQTRRPWSPSAGGYHADRHHVQVLFKMPKIGVKVSSEVGHIDDVMAGREQHESDRRCDFATLWAESYDKLRTYVRIFVPVLHDADDVLQDTAVAIAKDFDKYDPERPFLEWAVGVARNRVLQYYRKRGRDRRMIFDVDTVSKIEGSLLELEPRIDSYEESLEFCLQKLPERSRRMLELRYTCTMSADEIASQLKMTVQSVYTRLSQIRVALRDCVRRQLRRSGGSAP
jgi:RNA polymerase sigma-70 factor (ECF subfamily)